MSLVENYIAEYIENMLTDCPGELGELQRKAYEEGLPIIPKDVVKLLGFILGIKKPRAVLEIGMAVGFSASFMSQFLPEDGYIKTIDRYPVMIERARENFKKFGLENKITILEGNANDILPDLEEQFDFVFMDAAKGQYITILPDVLRLTKKGGIIFAAYVISDGCLIDEGFNRSNISVVQYIKDGLLDPETFAAKSEPKDLFELVRKEDIDDLMKDFPVTRLHYAATDGCAMLIREAIEQMDDEIFQLYLKYHLATCEREDLTGITSHAIDVFQK